MQLSNLGRIIRHEFAHTIAGVEGRMFSCIGGTAPGTFSNQQWKASREYREDGQRYRITWEMRWDDNCRNGQNSFGVCGSIDQWEPSKYPERSAKDARGTWREDRGGQCTEELAKRFPELAHLLPFHLHDTRGPLHYVANAVYHASDRDHWGKRKGEPRAFETRILFGDNPLHHAPGNSWTRDKFLVFLQGAHPSYDLEVIALYNDKDPQLYGAKYTFGGFADKWHECPFDTEGEALRFLDALRHCNPRYISVATAWGEGKDRDLDAARRAANWPEATDEELMQEPAALRAALGARAPALLERLRAAVESCGFLYECPEVTK